MRSNLAAWLGLVFSSATLATAQEKPVPVDRPVWTVVVPDDRFAAALQRLVEHRERQGLEFVRVGLDAEPNVDALRARVRNLVEQHPRGYLLLVGDDVVPAPTRPGLRKISAQHPLGAESVDADAAFGDRDDDGAPEWAVGRIPVSTPEELSVVVDKILAYESRAAGDWQRDVSLIANSGNFGETIDAMLENAVNQLFREHLDPLYRMRGVVGMEGSPFRTEPAAFLDAVLGTIDAGPFAVVYAGHGQRSRFASFGGKPVLRVRDVARLTGHGDRTVLLSFACHVGKYRGGDCLGEVLLRTPSGPCAVFAASDVSFPYGDALLGYELMRALRSRDGELRLGDLIRAARCAVIEHADSEFGQRADTLANLTGLDPDTRAGLRRYTADLYHVLGDPAMTLRLPRPLDVTLAEPGAKRGEALRFRIGAHSGPHPERVTIELCVDRGRDLVGDPPSDVETRRVVEWGNDDELAIELPAFESAGRYASVRVFGVRDGMAWAGGLRFRLGR